MDNNDLNYLREATIQRSENLQTNNLLLETISRSKVLLNRFFVDDVDKENENQRNVLQVMHFLSICWSLQLSSSDNLFEIDDIVDTYLDFFAENPAQRVHFNLQGSKNDVKQKLSEYATLIITSILVPRSQDTNIALQTLTFDANFNYRKHSVQLIQTVDLTHGRIGYRLPLNLQIFLAHYYEAIKDKKAGINFDILFSNIHLDHLHPENTYTEIRKSENMLLLHHSNVMAASKKTRQRLSAKSAKEYNKLHTTWSKVLKDLKARTDKGINNLKNQIKQNKIQLNYNDEENERKVKLYTKCWEAYEHFRQTVSNLLQETIEDANKTEDIDFHFTYSWNMKKLTELFDMTDPYQALSRIPLLDPIIKMKKEKVFNPEILEFPLFPLKKKTRISKENQIALLTEKDKQLVKERVAQQKAEYLSLLKHFFEIMKERLLENDAQKISQLIKSDTQLEQLYYRDFQFFNQLFQILGENPFIKTNGYSSPKISLNEVELDINTVKMCLNQVSNKERLSFSFTFTDKKIIEQQHCMTDLLCRIRKD